MLDPKKKKVAITIGIVLFLIVIVPLGKFIIKKVRAFPVSILSFSPATKIIGNNQDFTLDAKIDPRTNQVTAVELHVTFDQTKFRLDSIGTAGSPFSVTLQAAAINNTNGTASIVVGVPAASPIVPVTTISNVATFSFHSLAAVSNSSIAFASTTQAAALGESIDVLSARNPSAVTVDAAAPTGGSITYVNGYYKAASVALTVADGTDAVAGLNTASRIVQRKSATLTGTACGTFGAWGNITPTGTYPNLTDTTVANGNCYQYQYLISDNAGNQAAYASANVAKVDMAAPALAQVTAVPSLTNDATPDYTFSSTEAGTITYAGDCSSATTAAVSGNNTVTFNTLTSAAHSNCTIRVTDAATNQSNVLSVNSFTVDALPPTITSVTSNKADGAYSMGAVIDVVVNFSEAVTSTGAVTVTLDTGRTCAFTVTNATNGSCNYTVQNGDNTADLTTTAISGTVADQAGNALTNFSPAINLGANKNLVISALAPILAQVTPVPTISSDTTPDYTFSSSKAGTVTFGGSCSSTATTAVAGDNIITFNALAVGTYNNCTVIVTDMLGNASAPLSVNSFAVTYKGDIDLNRTVNLFDYSILVSNFGNAACGNQADTDKNCKVDIFDYNALVGDFGRSF